MHADELALRTIPIVRELIRCEPSSAANQTLEMTVRIKTCFQILVTTIATAWLAACTPAGEAPTAVSQFDHELQAIRDAVSQAVGYSREDVGVIGSRLRLQISISDAKLAAADPAAREQEAAALVTATERALASHPDLSAVEAISIVIVHPTAGGEAPTAWHVEDVVDFRKGPNQRFSLHGPT